MQVEKQVAYAQVTQAAAATVKSTSGNLAGAIVISSTAGTLTVYDNTAASGTKLLDVTGLTAGQIIHFGGNQVRCNKGLHVVVGGTATVNILYV